MLRLKNNKTIGSLAAKRGISVGSAIANKKASDYVKNNMFNGKEKLEELNQLKKLKTIFQPWRI